MKMLVTGATGFVGAELVNHLKIGGFQVNTATRRPFNNLAGCNYIVGNIERRTNWNKALNDCDGVIHLAARVHVMKDNNPDPLAEFLNVNLHATANLAQQAAAAGVKRFVYVSSIKVNGEHTRAGQAFNELSNAEPEDAYAISKWEAEQALHKISQETGMEVVIVRPPLVYGPRVKANFAKLLQLIDRGIPIPLGSVHNLRSLLYVGNLVDALIACATHPAAAGQVYLVSDGEDVSTPQLVDGLAKASHRPHRVFAMPLSVLRGAARFVGKSAAIDRLTQSLVIDSSKIRKELGWKPPYTIAQGLQATADWYRQASRFKPDQ